MSEEFLRQLIEASPVVRGQAKASTGQAQRIVPKAADPVFRLPQPIPFDADPSPHGVVHGIAKDRVRTEARCEAGRQGYPRLVSPSEVAPKRRHNGPALCNRQNHRECADVARSIHPISAIPAVRSEQIAPNRLCSRSALGTPKPTAQISQLSIDHDSTS